MLRPFQAGNVSAQLLGEGFCDRFRAIPTGLRFGQELEQKKDFKWGDVVTISQLHKQGLQNNLCTSCNLGSVPNSPVLIYSSKDRQIKDSISKESMFQLIPRECSDLGNTVRFDENKEAVVYLRSILTGRFLYFSREEGRLLLAGDFAESLERLRRAIGGIQSSYRKQRLAY